MEGKKLVGIFWDIENCPVPKNKYASAVINHIRNSFVINRLNHREFEFLIACDVSKMRKEMVDDINRAGIVTLAHVSGTAKNAADEKLRESMRRFVDTHAFNASVPPLMVLISGDVDFAHDVRSYQARHGCNIVVVHSEACSVQFKTGWNEVYAFKDFCAAVPNIETQNGKVPTSKSANPPEKGNKQPPQTGGGGKGPGQGNANPKAKGNQDQNFQGPRPGGPRQPGPRGPAPGFQQNDPRQQQPGQGPRPNGGFPNGPRPPNAGFQQNGPRQANAGFQPNGPRQPNAGFQPNGPRQPNAGSQQNGPRQQQPDQGPRPQQPGGGTGKVPNPDKCILMVSGLPGKLDFKILKDHLQEHADEVRGRVKYVDNGQGFISFKNKQDANNAIKRFHGMEVYGKKLNVTVVERIPFKNPQPGSTAKPGSSSDFVTAPKPPPPQQQQQQAKQPNPATAGSKVKAQAQHPPTPLVTSQASFDTKLAGVIGTLAGAAIREMNKPEGGGKQKKGHAKPEADPNCCIM